MAKPRASRPHMPGYGIADPRKGNGLFPWRWAKERLEKGRTYFLSTVDSAGKPHMMPVWGVWFGDAFYFSTGRQSKKARNLSFNARCSVATELDFERRPKKKDQVKDAIILEGLAELISDSSSRKRFLTLYEDKYAWDMEGFEEPIYRVRPRVVFGFSSEFTQTATRWRFDDEAEM